MKKNLFLLPVLLATTILSVAARPLDNNDPQTMKNFQKQFAGAENVKLVKVEDGFTKISFTWNGHRTEAYFNQSAEFVGAIRGLFYEQLPLSVIRAVDKEFKQPTVLEVREITNAEGTSYSLLMEKKNGRYKVRVNSFGNVESETKVK